MIAQYLPACIILISLSLVIAIILYVADKYLGYYGPCRIEISNALDRSFTIEGGRSLMSCLDERKIYLPSSCGGDGTCGYCRVTVHDGGGAVLPLEKLSLSRAQIAAQTRLACQVKIRTDMSISVPEDILLAREFQANVIKIDDVAPDLKQITLALLNPQVMSFHAGQYVQLHIPNTDQLRSYSITSTPDDPTQIELLVKRVPGGLCSEYMHNELNEDDQITILGPYGEFCTDKYLGIKPLPTLVFIAGGCGIAPIISILKDLYNKKVRNTIYLFYGARCRDELYFYDEYMRRSGEGEHFHFIPAISDTMCDSTWKGEIGNIHTVVDKYSFEFAKTFFWVCGPEIMVTSVLDVLNSHGYPHDHLHADMF